MSTIGPQFSTDYCLLQKTVLTKATRPLPHPVTDLPVSQADWQLSGNRQMHLNDRKGARCRPKSAGLLAIMASRGP